MGGVGRRPDGAVVRRGHAEDRLAPPASDAVLMVSGKIARTTDGVAALFDRDMLEALGTVALSLHLPESSAPALYEGVPASAVLDFLAADGQSLTVRTFDNGETVVSITDLQSHGAILAVRWDGAYLDSKDLGPVMLIYAEDGVPGGTEDRCIMRLASLRVD